MLHIAQNAKLAKKEIGLLSKEKKNIVLKEVATALVENSEMIMAANHIDMQKGREKGLSQGLLDRLLLDEERIQGMADGLLSLISLEDPIGRVSEMEERPNGLLIGKKTVPLGVVAVIYEARPNVTVDVFGLCLKTNNVVILKGGSDGLASNTVIEEIIRTVLEKQQINPNGIQLIKDTSRESTYELMQLYEYIDVLIPRGGKGLIQEVVLHSKIPVIETGTGNCHAYIEKSADFDKALKIIVNGKTQRIGVCNALESLVVDEAIVPSFLPLADEILYQKGVEIRADKKALAYMPHGILATQEDYYTEYLDKKISIKVVSGIEEGIDHINECSSGHSETIITQNYDYAQKFLKEIDSSCVYVNASTRFTDGFEFGYGAEIGISTQKLHARGPMGLEALTSYKYIIYGDGQIRG